MAGSRFKGENGGLLGGESLTGTEMEGEDSPSLIINEVPQGDVRGVYAVNPATTPKYHTGNTDATREYMARLFVPFASDVARKVFVESVPQRSRALAEVLAVSNSRAAEGLEGGSRRYGLGYIDFLLQSATEAFQEKTQLVEMVGDNYVQYYFGQRPPTFQYSGMLLNSYQDDWRSAFTLLYNDVLRGTMLARKKVVVVLAYDEVLVTGTLANFQQVLTADFELAAAFNFSMVVKRYDISSRSPRRAFVPTQVRNWPYNLKPSRFSNLRLAQTTRSIWAGNAVTLTSSNQRKKTTESGAQPAEGFVIGLVESTADPERDYLSDTVYNSSVGTTIAQYEAQSRQQSESNALDDDLFGQQGQSFGTGE